MLMRATVKKSCMSEGPCPSSRFQGDLVSIPETLGLSQKGCSLNISTVSEGCGILPSSKCGDFTTVAADRAPKTLNRKT